MSDPTDNVFIALGSNLGDRLANLQSAVTHLEDAGVEIVAGSCVYQTAPVGVRVQQDDYFNAVIQSRVAHTPLELLDLCLSIESRMGRVRRETNEARIIDLDIVLFAEQVIQSDRLTIPHPRLHVRRFVLEPLAEIEPEVIHPIHHKPVRELLSELSDSSEPPARRITDAGWFLRQSEKPQRVE